MLASTKNDNEKIVSAHAPPILKCYLVSVSNEARLFSWIQFSRRSSMRGYNLFIIIVRWQHLPFPP